MSLFTGWSTPCRNRYSTCHLPVPREDPTYLVHALALNTYFPLQVRLDGGATHLTC